MGSVPIFPLILISIIKQAHGATPTSDMDIGATQTGCYLPLLAKLSNILGRETSKYLWPSFPNPHILKTPVAAEFLQLKKAV